MRTTKMQVRFVFVIFVIFVVDLCGLIFVVPLRGKSMLTRSQQLGLLILLFVFIVYVVVRLR